MVERLLVLLAAMAAPTLGMAAKTGLDVRTNRSFTSAAPRRVSKWPQQVNLIPPGFLPRAHAPDGRSSSYPRQIEEGSVTSPEEMPPGVLEPSCLQLLTCQKENQFYFHRMEIYHADLPERSAAACGHLCLRQRPDAQLVMAKLSHINEQLVCGCGEQEAVPRVPALGVPPVCSQPCPDGGGSCGGPETVSVYQLDRDRKECVAPSYSYFGCYYGDMGEVSLTLGPWERWAGGCRARCGAPPTSGDLMRLSTTADGTTLCECWLKKADLESSRVQSGQGCGWRCPDGEGWCGDAELTSVYMSSAAMREHLLPSLFLLLLLLLLPTLVLGFIHNDVLV